MAKVIALYGMPADPAAFNRYYFSTHVPLAKTLPGLLTYEVSEGAVSDLSGNRPYHLAATLTFKDMAGIQAALVSPEGVATAADLGNFATGGVTLLIFDSKFV
jgi:uncharacterized protein (TIGR02118 family)